MSLYGRFFLHIVTQQIRLFATRVTGVVYYRNLSGSRAITIKQLFDTYNVPIWIRDIEFVVLYSKPLSSDDVYCLPHVWIHLVENVISRLKTYPGGVQLLLFA